MQPYRLLTAVALWVALGIFPVHAAGVMRAPDDIVLPLTDRVIVDVRPAARFAEGHIPGAVNLPVALTIDTAQSQGDIVNTRIIEQLLGGLGISRSDRVLLVGDGGLRDAAWMFWVLDLHGSEGTQLLEGGMPGWIRSGGPLSRRVDARPAVRYQSRINPRAMALKLDLRIASGSGAWTILDARSTEEFLGLRSEGPRKGRIPGASSLPWQSLVDEVDGVRTLKAPVHLAATFERLNPEGRRVLLYCNRGKASSTVYLAMRSLGLQGELYDGSWIEWSSDPRMPIEAGPR